MLFLKSVACLAVGSLSLRINHAVERAVVGTVNAAVPKTAKPFPLLAALVVAVPPSSSLTCCPAVGF